VSHRSSEEQPCRTCGKPRGENIAEGTRCADCGRRQALQLCLAGAGVAAATALAAGVAPSAAAVAGVVVAVVMAPAFVATVVLHELTHAVTATLLGGTVVRVIVGEGRALFRIGRRPPQIVVGRVVLGNGVTSVVDLRRPGYRWRTCTMLLSAPAVSLMVALAAWQAGTGWALAARSAALTFALCNLAMAMITLLPTPTFGERVE
jgi:hypothetical protein